MSGTGTRILVAGAGALGSMLGGFLRRAGHDVTLLGRERHVVAIRDRGLEIGGIWGEHRVSGFRCATRATELTPPFDLVILAVKSYAMEEAAAALAGTLAEDGAVLSVQNGLGNVETVARFFPRERVLAAPVLIGAAVPSPGSVRVTVYAKPVMIGASEEGTISPFAARTADMLAGAGIPAEATERILAYLWEKVLYNAALNPLGAILRLPYGALAAAPEGRAILDGVLDEGHAVAAAGGVDLLWPTAAECRRHFHEELLPSTAHHRSSMLQDLENGRPTEIEAINGYLWRRGTELGVATPVNAVLTRLIRLVESR
jgi:2-dehydropantoate 2-reductase